jgi:vanillate O-demethylase monooxygenase subunit
MSRALRNTEPALRRAWHPVARSVDVGDAPVRVRLLGEDWVLVRLPDGLTAFVDRCPHRLAPLSAGWVDGAALRCGYHGWCFASDGHCTEIPSMGTDEHLPPRAQATTAAGVAERHGMVFVAPAPPLAGAGLLDVPEADDPSFMHGHLDPIPCRVGAGLMIDNFFDIAHFPFLHAATIGASESAALDSFDFSVERDGFGMRVHSTHPFPNREDPGVARGERPLLQHRRLEYRYKAPFLICLRIDYVEAGGTNVLEFYVQPEDDERCTIYSSVHRNDLDGDEHRLAECLAFERKVVDEDLGLQERYRDLSLPLDLTTEVHVKADRMTIELRRVLADLVTAASAAD